MLPTPAIIDVSICPVPVHLGPLTVRWYGVLFASAFLLGGWMAVRHLLPRGLSRDTVYGLLLWSGVAGIVGARLCYVASSQPDYYLTHPHLLFATWQGGMGFCGAAASGVVALLYLCRRWGLDTWLPLDATALLVGVALPIGRVANLVNGDWVGAPSSLPWATRYTDPDSLAPQLGVAYQPAAAYEALLLIGPLAAVLLLRRRGVPTGMLAISYLCMFGASQLLLPFLHGGQPPLALGMPGSQWAGIVALAAGVPLLLLSRPGREAGVPEAMRVLLRDVWTRRTNRLLRILVLATSSVVDAAGPTRLRRRLHRLRARTATFSEPQ